jgi:hypothetical protein
MTMTDVIEGGWGEELHLVVRASGIDGELVVAVGAMNEMGVASAPSQEWQWQFDGSSLVLLFGSMWSGLNRAA